MVTLFAIDQRAQTVPIVFRVPGRPHLRDGLLAKILEDPNRLAGRCFFMCFVFRCPHYAPWRALGCPGDSAPRHGAGDPSEPRSFPPTPAARTASPAWPRWRRWAPSRCTRGPCSRITPTSWSGRVLGPCTAASGPSSRGTRGPSIAATTGWAISSRTATSPSWWWRWRRHHRHRHFSAGRAPAAPRWRSPLSGARQTGA
jgi:hypothetical protein